MSDLYFVENIGCDDETRGLVVIPDIVLPYVQSAINNLNKNSQYGCMPTIELYKIDSSFIRPATEDDRAKDVLHTNYGDYVLTKDILFYDRDEREFKLAKGVEKVC